MLALATFLTICGVAVLFLLRFLFALESETRSARTRRAAAVVRVSANRLQPVSQRYHSAPVLTVVPNASRQAVAWPKSPDSRVKNSEYKEA
jgi:hypothetical protein